MSGAFRAGTAVALALAGCSGGAEAPVDAADIPDATSEPDVSHVPDATPAACANDLDDDLDGYVDGLDPGCSSAADDDEYNVYTVGCPGPWEDITITRMAAGSFDGTGVSYLEGTCGGNGPERYYYLFVATGTHTFVISTNHPETTADTIVYVGWGCTSSDSELACSDDLAPASPGPSEVTVPLLGPDIYFIMVDSYAVGSVGDFLLTVTEVPP